MPWHEILSGGTLSGRNVPGVIPDGHGPGHNGNSFIPRLVTFIPRLVTALAAVVVIAGTALFLMRSRIDRETTNIAASSTPYTEAQQENDYTDYTGADSGNHAYGPGAAAGQEASDVPANNGAGHSAKDSGHGKSATDQGNGGAPTVTGQGNGGASASRPGSGSRKDGSSRGDGAKKPAYTYPADPFAEKTAARGKRWSAKTYIAGAATGSHSEYSYTPLASAAPVYGTTLGLPEMNDKYIPVTTLDQNPSSQMYASHLQPLKLGLRFSKSVGTDWSIETGVQYSLLRSEFSSGLSTSVQYLNYIGIPLSVNFRFASLGNSSFYASAGAAAEKMIYGKRDSERVYVRPLQYSVSASLGAEYRLGRTVYLFAEPSVGYYPDNGSDVRCYYNDRAVVFSISLGARIPFI